MSGVPVCPQCNVPVEAHWDWCHACGFDPEGKRAIAEAQAAAAPVAPSAAVPPAVAAFGAAFPGAGAPVAPLSRPSAGAPEPTPEPTPEPAPAAPTAPPAPAFGQAPPPSQHGSPTAGPQPFGSPVASDAAKGPAPADVPYVSPYDPYDSPYNSADDAATYTPSVAPAYAPSSDARSADQPSADDGSLVDTSSSLGDESPFEASPSFASFSSDEPEPPSFFAPSGSPAPGEDVPPDEAGGHPYAALPYAPADASTPSPALPAVPPPPPTGGPGEPGGFRPMAAGGPAFGSAPAVGPGPIGGYAPPGASPSGGPGSSAPQAGGAALATPAGPGFVTGGGYAPAPVVLPPAANAPTSSQGKMIAIGVVGVLVLVVLGAGLIKLASPSRDVATKVTDPNAPKPLGEVVTGQKGTTVTTASSTNPSGINTKEGWVTYRSPDGTFQVDFPGQVTTRSRQRPIGGQQLVQLDVRYEVGVEGGGMIMSSLDLTSASLYADSQAAFDRINESTEPKMVAVGPFEIDAKSGLHYSFDAGGKTGLGVLLVDGKRIYLLEAIDVSDVDFSKFVYSFHVL